MPPLSFTQSKYACIISGPLEKSMPGTDVVTLPMTIGSPVAGSPVPMPQKSPA